MQNRHGYSVGEGLGAPVTLSESDILVQGSPPRGASPARTSASRDEATQSFVDFWTPSSRDGGIAYSRVGAECTRLPASDQTPGPYDLQAQQRQLDMALAQMGLEPPSTRSFPSPTARSAEHGALVKLHTAAARQVERRGSASSQDRALLDLASVMLEASDAPTDRTTEEREASAALENNARAAIDLALDFVPGVGLAKDLVSIATRVNPVTHQRVGDVELGLIVAGVFVPGVAKGLGKACLQAGRRVGQVLRRRSVPAPLAHQLLVALARARHFLGSLGKAVADYTPDELRLLARGAEHSREAVEKSAREARLLRGTAFTSAALPPGDRFLRGTCANAGFIPRDIADALRGRDFASFDALRRALWKAVADSPHAHRFDPSSLKDMRRGGAPAAAVTQWHQGQRVYHLHHITPIHRGGDVYDLSNLMVTTPLFHSQVLDASYHFGHRGGLP